MNIPTYQTISETESTGFEVEISYSEHEIADKLTRYGLVQSVLFNQLDANLLRFLTVFHRF